MSFTWEEKKTLAGIVTAITDIIFLYKKNAIYVLFVLDYSNLN